jgi:inner membrane transporter RhtA
MGTSDHGLAGLALATLLGAVLVLPFGVATAGSALLDPATLALGLAIGVLSSALPYSLDLLALRRLSTAVFGVLTSLNPAAAALAGLVVLGELPPHRQLVGIALVVVASVGVTAAGRRRRSLLVDVARDRPHRPGRDEGRHDGSREREQVGEV